MNAIGPVPRPLTSPTFEPILGYAQVNVRTYVKGPHGPGIVLLDTRVNSMIAAMGASLLGQPYRYAAGMTVDRGLTRQRIVAPGGAIDAVIAPGAPATTVPGSLASFLVDRYVVYDELPGGAPYAARIEHEPWLLRDAVPDVTGAPLARHAGIEHAEGPLAAHVAEPVSVAIVEIDGAGRGEPAPDRQ